MGGGLMQIVAYGAQDVYLTGNPQITFFKVVYRRHTNFAMESISQTFNGTSTSLGSKVSCTISRNGDLIHKMYLRVLLPTVAVTTGGDFCWAEKVGLALIKNVELEIGGQRIDKQYGDWMNIWNELSLPESKRGGWLELVGGSDNGANASTSDVINRVCGRTFDESDEVGGTATGTTPQIELNIPLEFWFCRNPGLALPLIALQYHEVKVNIEYNSTTYLASQHQDSGATGDVAIAGTTITGTADSVTSPSFSLESSTLWVDYIYLDTDERRRFAQTSHEYLIEQLQYTGEETVSTTSTTQRLNFNHPVKELVWVCQPSAHVETDESSLDAATRVALHQFKYEADMTNGSVVVPTLSGDTGSAGVNPMTVATLKLNGHDRMAERSGVYYNSVQPFQHHTRVPKDKGINVYSFALKPEEHQPSGTCNMSRIDVAQLQMTLRTPVSGDNYKVRIYATNYNVLRIMSGMGGLAYAN